jgi:hypothetical protein
LRLLDLSNMGENEELSKMKYLKRDILVFENAFWEPDGLTSLTDRMESRRDGRAVVEDDHAAS